MKVSLPVPPAPNRKRSGHPAFLRPRQVTTKHVSAIACVTIQFDCKVMVFKFSEQLMQAEKPQHQRRYDEKYPRPECCPMQVTRNLRNNQSAPAEEPCGDPFRCSESPTNAHSHSFTRDICLVNAVVAQQSVVPFTGLRWIAITSLVRVGQLPAAVRTAMTLRTWCVVERADLGFTPGTTNL